MKEGFRRGAEDKRKYGARCFGLALILQLILQFGKGIVLKWGAWSVDTVGGYVFYNVVRLLLTACVFFVPLTLYLKLTEKSFSDIVRPRRNPPIYRAKCGGAWFKIAFFLFAAAITLNLSNLAGIATNGVYALLGLSVPNTTVIPVGVAVVFSFLSSVVFAPILEETLFRGVALNALSPYGMRWTVLVSGVLFALMHCNFYQFFYAFVAGCAIAFFAYVSNSLWVAVGLHFLNNLLTLVTQIIRSLGGPSAAQSFGNNLLVVTLPIALFGVGFFVKMRIWRIPSEECGNCGEHTEQNDTTENGSPICVEMVIFALFALLGCF